MSDAQVVVTVVVGVLAFVGTVGTAVLASRQKGLTDLTERLQVEIEALRRNVSDNDKRIGRLESRDRAWADYVHILRRHINDQKPPPPPEWPPGLDV